MTKTNEDLLIAMIINKTHVYMYKYISDIVNFLKNNLINMNYVHGNYRENLLIMIIKQLDFYRIYLPHIIEHLKKIIKMNDNFPVTIYNEDTLTYIFKNNMLKKRGWKIIVELLNNKKPIQTILGFNALLYACKHNYTSKILSKLILIENVKHLSPSNKNALIYISKYRKGNYILKLLIERGCNINQQSNLGYTALMAATRYNRHINVKFLLENSADPNLITKTKQRIKYKTYNYIYANALWFACRYGTKLNIIKLLIDRTDDFEKNIIYIDNVCRYNKKVEIIKYVINSFKENIINDYLIAKLRSNNSPIMRSKIDEIITIKKK
jgi:ankyrin repeat protein